MSHRVELQGGVRSKFVFEMTPVELLDQVNEAVAPAVAGGANVPLKLAPKADVHSSKAAVTRKMANFLIASSMGVVGNGRRAEEKQRTDECPRADRAAVEGS